jgi:hypothetical protein
MQAPKCYKVSQICFTKSSTLFNLPIQIHGYALDKA